MGKILLDYVFPISVITPTPEASTAFLKQVCVVAKPKSGQEGNVGNLYECTSMTAVGVRTDNTNAQQLFNAGMSKVYILLANDLDLEDAMAEHGQLFYTLLVSDDFVDADFVDTAGDSAVAATLTVDDLTFTAKTPGAAGNDLSIELLDQVDAGEEVAHATGDVITVLIKTGVSTTTQIKAAIDDSVSASNLISVAIASGQGASAQAAFAEDNLEDGADATSNGILVGTYGGVIGISTPDDDVAEDQAVIDNRVAFFEGTGGNGAKNMFYAFGKLLSNAVNWTNQQYITMPFDDGIDELGEANAAFDDKVSFVIKDDEFGIKLALFAVGGRAIVAPYILKNLRVDLQSRTLQWISGNQPQYTLKEAALLETRLQEDVINEFIALNWITAGTVEITLVEDNFVASGAINVAEPKALWRVYGEMRSTL